MSGIFTDYVNRESDLRDAWKDSPKDWTGYVDGTPDLLRGWNKAPASWDGYVDSHKDLIDAWNNQAVSWHGYVNGHPDLKEKWRNFPEEKRKRYRDNKGDYPTGRALWGAQHYFKSGKKEGRTVPKQAAGTDALGAYHFTRDTWGQDHYNRYGERQGRAVPKKGHAGVGYHYNKDTWGKQHYTDTGKSERRAVPRVGADGKRSYWDKESWGAAHWDKYGKNESRALPGPKFSEKNGKLIFNTSLVGSGLQKNYQAIADSFNNSTGGNYKGLMEGAVNALPAKYQSDILSFNSSGGLSNDAATFTGFYSKYKVDRYDSSKGAKPPKGIFDAKYYATQNEYGKQAMQEWNANSNNVFSNLGLNLPNLDYTQRYAAFVDGVPYDFLNKKYTDIKNTPGISDLNNRANAAADTNLANAVLENWNTFDPNEKDAFQNKLLGLDKQGASGQYYVDFQNPYVVDEEGNTVYETDEFGNQTPKINPANLSYLESSVFNVFGKKDLEQQDRFKALALDVLKNSVDELNKQRNRERQLNIYKGLPGFNEVYGANSSIANSLLGDSGIGGYLSMLGTNVDKLSEDLEKQLEGVTGISNNSSVYNWQKWFNDTLLDRYENLEEVTGKLSGDIEGLDPILDNTKWNNFKTKIDAATEGTEEYEKLLKDNNLALGLSKERALEIKDPNNWKALLEKYGLSTDLTKDQALDIFKDSSKEIQRIYTIEDDFREKFIDEYIKPRFDQSKSMDEFISYLDTMDEDEQNIFQTQDALQELKNVANAYSVAKLQSIQNMGDSTFDADFYFDPTVSIDSRFEGPKDEAYRQQKEKVAADWETAKNNPNAIIPGTESTEYPNGFSWYQYAYYYGLDLNNKADFAKLHHDVVGYRKNFDAAKDITSIGDIRGYITDIVLPKVAEAKLEIGDAAFSAFTTPEEYADYLLKGIDPTENNPEWKEILNEFGLDDDTSLDELKDYIIDATRTGAAQDIRESIKFLNERKLTPTQERLGVTYIERPEDAKDIEDEDASALYKIFADAGYGGTEDEFYTDFMPDVDRGDIELITAGLGGSDKFKLKEIKDDPFAALSTVSSFLDDGTDFFGNETKEKTKSSDEYDYFNLFDDKDDYKSDAGRDYISEYQTFFG